MAGQYATSTKVGSDRSIAEIERTLMRYGARGFMYGRDEDRGAAVIAFKANDRQVRFVLPLPDIRRVGPEGILPNGGAVYSLCEPDWWTHGWDIPGLHPSVEENKRQGDQLCRACVSAFDAAVSRS
jgi:hypothetical protein